MASEQPGPSATAAAAPASDTTATLSQQGEPGSSSNNSNSNSAGAAAAAPHNGPSAKQTAPREEPRRRRRKPRPGQVDRGVPEAERIGLDAAQGGPRAAKRRHHSSSSSSSRDAPTRGESPTDGTSFPSFRGDLPWSQRGWLYELKPFRGMYYDLRRRAPYYLSDWTVTFEPRNWWTVAQAVVRIYFIK